MTRNAIMKKTRLSLPARAALVATVAAVLSTGCSANFKDGETTCSLQNTCPDGFVCDVTGGRKCRKPGSTGTPDAGPGPTPTQPDAATPNPPRPDAATPNPPRPDAGPGPTPGQMCQPTDPSKACDVCLAQSCCAELSACQNNAACGMFVTCARACAENDDACVEACATKHPAGAMVFASFSMCFSMKCRTQCM